MKKGSSEFYAAMESFESLEKIDRTFRASRLSDFKKDYYNNGALNEKFIMFLAGMSFGRCYYS